MAKITAKVAAKKTSAGGKAATRLRVVLAPDAFLGPGKGELLERIAASGSISAAGRAMGMSYKRAWQLVETLNGYFRAPLVQAATGGKAGGGAQLTALGRQVLAHYQAMTAATEKACARNIAALQKLRKT
ncbi:LysR family transcriptional regulator [Ferrovibrio sp.]|uniref:winged helix-turn-helix domain-containing protein n=1 Tax=Ferrovibrio sp. TaxID=1917215 RepID=UPI000CA9FF6F|nr:LysR family transcriptional regulator [Ferrovibrio sp.]PJI39633.1 MAG: molybdenum-binding transcriptional regulator [Ferrovibrio sp.]